MPSFIQIQITNSDTPDENEIHRYLDGQTKDDAIKIADGLPPDALFKDFNVQSGQLYWYFVRAITGGLATDGTADDISVVFDQLYIHAVDREGMLSNAIDNIAVGLINEAPQTLEAEQQVGSYNLKGRSRPLAAFGQITSRLMNCTVTIQRSQQATYDNLIDIWRQNDIVCARDPVGNRLFGRIARFDIVESSQLFRVSFTVLETDYTEGL